MYRVAEFNPALEARIEAMHHFGAVGLHRLIQERVRFNMEVTSDQKQVSQLQPKQSTIFFRPGPKFTIGLDAFEGVPSLPVHGSWVALT